MSKYGGLGDHINLLEQAPNHPYAEGLRDVMMRVQREEQKRGS